MEDWPGGIPAFQKCEGGMHMALFVGIDVSKEKFDDVVSGSKERRSLWSRCA